MNISLLITKEANYEPKLVVEPNSGAKAFPLKKDVLQVIRYAKAEIPNQLKVRFEFKTNSILEPHQLRLTNVGSLGKLALGIISVYIDNIRRNLLFQKINFFL